MWDFGVPVHASDVVVMHDLVANVFSDATFPINVPNQPVISIRDVSGSDALVETDSGGVVHLRYAGNPSLNSATVFAGYTGAVPVQPNALFYGSTSVVYQSEQSGGGYLLNFFNLVSQTAGLTYGPYSTPLNPSATSGTGIAIEGSTSVLMMGIDDGGPYFGSSPNPSTLAGCDYFRGMKPEWSPFLEVWLVQGVNCTGLPVGVSGQSVLIALARSGSSSWQAYYVGQLSATEPEYDLFGDEITYVDDLGDVQWLKYDL